MYMSRRMKKMISQPTPRDVCSSKKDELLLAIERSYLFHLISLAFSGSRHRFLLILSPRSHFILGWRNSFQAQEPPRWTFPSRGNFQEKRSASTPLGEERCMKTFIEKPNCTLSQSSWLFYFNLSSRQTKLYRIFSVLCPIHKTLLGTSEPEQYHDPNTYDAWKCTWHTAWDIHHWKRAYLHPQHRFWINRWFYFFGWVSVVVRRSLCARDQSSHLPVLLRLLVDRVWIVLHWYSKRNQTQLCWFCASG